MVLKELLNDIEIIETQADPGMEIAGVCCDSSKVKPGWLFVAIKGYKSDGHDYIDDALAKGAACIVCRQKPGRDAPYVLVENTRKAMAQLSAQWFGHPAKKMKMVGVTGTNGKTSITYLLKHIIEQCEGCKVGLIGTIENLIGNTAVETSLTTPDSYELQELLSQMGQDGCKYVVMEVSSHALYLDRVHGIRFETGIFTNLTRDHLDFHRTMDDYADAKAILFQNSKNSIINIDDSFAQKMIDKSTGKVKTYAVKNKGADITAKSVKLLPDKTKFTTNIYDNDHRITVGIPGMFTVYNALAAVAAGISLGIAPKDIKKALGTCKGVRGRAEVIETKTDYTVLVDYAHTPDALENIIRTARSISKGKVHTLFGCGGDRDRTKRPLMGKIASELSDFVTVTSDNPRTEDPEAIIKDILEGMVLSGKAQATTEANREEAKTDLKEGLKVITNRREAIREALDILMAGDVLVIAGKGHETYQMLGKEKIHFDDREVVLEHLKQTADNKRRMHVLG